MKAPAPTLPLLPVATLNPFIHPLARQNETERKQNKKSQRGDNIKWNQKPKILTMLLCHFQLYPNKSHKNVKKQQQTNDTLRDLHTCIKFMAEDTSNGQWMKLGHINSSDFLQNFKPLSAVYSLYYF